MRWGEGLEGIGSTDDFEGRVPMDMVDRLRSVIKTGTSFSKEDLLQIFMLGVLLGNKDIRSTIEPEDFSDVDMQCVCAELGHGKSYKFFKVMCLEFLGIDWKEDNGPPLRAMTARLKRNSRRNHVLAMLVKAAKSLEGPRSEEDLDLFFESCEEAGRRASADRQGDASSVSER